MRRAVEGCCVPGMQVLLRWGFADWAYDGHEGLAELALVFARLREGGLRGRTTMKHFVLSFALSALVIVAVSATTQAAYYHHRHHHYWHHHGYPVAWRGRGDDEASTR